MIRVEAENQKAGGESPWVERRERGSEISYTRFERSFEYENHAENALCAICNSDAFCDVIPPAMALNGNSSKMTVVARQVSEMFPTVFQMPVPSDGSLYIGAQIPSYRLGDEGNVELGDYESYLLFLNSEIIGIVDVVCNGNTVSQVTLGTKYANELQQNLLCRPNDPFAIIYLESGVYIKYLSSESAICIKTHSEGVTCEAISPISSATIQYCAAGDEVEVLVPPTITARAVYSKSIPITRVTNASTTCCQAGLCWAASIAMMSNYYTGTNLSALSLHNAYGCLGNDYHTDEMNLIRSLNMTPSGPYYTSTGPYPFSYSVLCNYIEANTLLLLDFQDYDDGVAHNVVAYGYYANTSTSRSYFLYMDPNNGGLMSSFPTTAGATVYVSLDGHNYQVHCYIAVTT